MTDDELVRGFEAGTLAAFHHADHVRLTIVLLARHGRADALQRLGEGLLLFATRKGHPEKFHVTLTRAWVDLIESARLAHPEAADAAALVGLCPELLNRATLERFYTPERLNSDLARTEWVPPDRAAVIELRSSANGSMDRPGGTGRI